MERKTIQYIYIEHPKAFPYEGKVDRRNAETDEVEAFPP